VPHSRAGFDELLRRTAPAALGRDGARVFAFEATGHVWEALAYRLRAEGERYVVVDPRPFVKAELGCPENTEVRCPLLTDIRVP
jgi:transposase